MRDEVRGHRAAMAPEGRRVAAQKRWLPVFELDALGRVARRRDRTCGPRWLGRLIAHGIGERGVRVHAASFALATTASTLLLSVRFTAFGATSVSTPDLRELKPPSLRRTAASAMLLTSVARSANCKLRLAATAVLEANRCDTSSTCSSFAASSVTPHRAFGLTLHACHRPAIASNPRRCLANSGPVVSSAKRRDHRDLEVPADRSTRPSEHDGIRLPSTPSRTRLL